MRMRRAAHLHHACSGGGRRVRSRDDAVDIVEKLCDTAASVVYTPGEIGRQRQLRFVHTECDALRCRRAPRGTSRQRGAPRSL